MSSCLSSLDIHPLPNYRLVMNQFRVLVDCLQRRRTTLTPATSSGNIISAPVPGSGTGATVAL